MAVVGLLVFLAPGQHHLVGVDDDHEIAGIHMGRVHGLVFSTQGRGDLRRHPAECLAVRVDNKPLAVDIGALGTVSLVHRTIRQENSR